MATTIPGVLGAFRHIDAACDAIEALRAQGRSDITVYSAAPSHEIEQALGHTTSPVRLFTLIGGITGLSAGIGMTFWMSLDWPLLVGGKPIATFPPFVVFMFELMVLLGALSTVAGVIILSLTRSTRGMAYDPSFTDDRIGIFVPAAGDQAGPVERLLREAGAEEVRHAA
jgi:ActD protein